MESLEKGDDDEKSEENWNGTHHNLKTKEGKWIKEKKKRRGKSRTAQRNRGIGKLDKDT